MRGNRRQVNPIFTEIWSSWPDATPAFLCTQGGSLMVLSWLAAPLGGRLLCAACAMGALVSLALTLAELILVQDDVRAELLAGFDRVAPELRDEIAASLAAEAFDETEAHLDRLLAAPEFALVALKTPAGLMWQRGGRSTGALARNVSRSFPIERAGAELGILTVSISLEGLFWRTLDQAPALVLRNFAWSLVLALMFLWVAERQILRHIRAIASQASDAAWISAGSKLSLDRMPRRRPDDLDALVTAINHAKTHAKKTHDALDRRAETLFLAGEALGDGREAADIEAMRALIRGLDGRDGAGRALVASPSAAETSDVALNDVVASAVEAIGPATQEADLRIGPLPTVSGHGGQLGILFRHLLTNALNYRDPDRPLRIDIMEEQAEDPAEIAVSVADTGIGIPDKYHARVFELFERLDPEGAVPGAGLGLALCRHIAENHAGRIVLTSRHQGGVQFTLYLPR